MDTSNSYIDQYTPPSDSSQAQPTQSTSDDLSSDSEKLEDQNIFFMLGVTDGTQDEREAFLDELQQVIWEDFLDSDVRLLLTDQEMVGLNNIMGKDAENSQSQQEEIINYIEKFVPDLEEIMYEKALELKEDMVRERIQGMREYYAQKSDKLAGIEQAEDLIRKDKWHSAAATLNSITD